MRAYYKTGLHFETADQVFKLQIGGRIFADWAMYDEDYESDGYEKSLISEDSHYWDNQVKMCSARLFMAGSLYKNTFFKAEFDFAGGDATFKDVYLGLSNVPMLANIRIGNQKMPFSLEALTSSRFQTFMGRAMAVEALAPGRQHGIMFYDAPCDGQWTWAVGFSGDSNDYGNGTTDKSLYLRIAGAPIYEPKAEQYTVVQIGGSIAYRRMDDDQWEFCTGPESCPAPEIVDTGWFEAEHGLFWGLEALVIYGPFSFQAEYMVADMDAKHYDDPVFSGWYAYASFFLTEGDRRHWGDTIGQRVYPKTLFHDDPGTGAVELALRYSDIDLDDEDVYGGEADTWTIGLNWYLNSQTRVMLNYIWGDADHDSRALQLNGKGYVDDVDIFQIRFQIDF
jgi:phosphate-selective porin OprO/OprP